MPTTLPGRLHEVTNAADHITLVEDSFRGPYIAVTPRGHGTIRLGARNQDLKSCNVTARLHAWFLGSIILSEFGRPWDGVPW